MAAGDKFDADLAQFKLGATSYACLTDYQMSDAVTIARAACSSSGGAVVHKSAGERDISFTFNVLLGSQDITLLNALAPGTTGAFEFHPEGDTASNIEMVAALGIVASRGMTGSIGSLTVVPITIEIDGSITIQAAS